MQTSISLAFGLWSAVVPALAIPRVGNNGSITISVGNLGGPKADGTTVLARTTDASIVLNNNPAVQFVGRLPGGTSLLSIVAHEIGHTLGLLHSTTPGTLMYPFDRGVEKLAAEDIAAVRALYSWTPAAPRLRYWHRLLPSAVCVRTMAGHGLERHRSSRPVMD